VNAQTNIKHQEWTQGTSKAMAETGMTKSESDIFLQSQGMK